MSLPPCHRRARTPERPLSSAASMNNAHINLSTYRRMNGIPSGSPHTCTRARAHAHAHVKNVSACFTFSKEKSAGQQEEQSEVLD